MKTYLRLETCRVSSPAYCFTAARSDVLLWTRVGLHWLFIESLFVVVVRRTCNVA
jgi:hypothetical protein